MTEARQTLETTLHGERFTVAADRPDIAAFWQRAEAGGWETDTLDFIDRHVDANTVFVDIGAWIGPISLYASRRAQRVLALEPDPVAHRELVQNISVNASNVDVWHVGVDNREGSLTLYAPSGLGQSITSSFKTDKAEMITVPTVTLDQVSLRLGLELGDATRVVVKVDIEGHEYTLIDAIIAFAQRHRAPLHISLHPRSLYESHRKTMSAFQAKRATWRATRALIAKLEALGPLTLCTTGRPLSYANLLSLLIRHRRSKNFSVETGR